MRSGNMSVENYNGTTTLRLHGNSIARMDAAGVISISNAGRNSRTTNDRLNGILHYLPGQGRVCCKDFSAYLNGAPWDGSWTVVHDPAQENARCLAVQDARRAARQAALDADLVAVGSDQVARAALFNADHTDVYNTTLAVLGKAREITSLDGSDNSAS